MEDYSVEVCELAGSYFRISRTDGTFTTGRVRTDSKILISGGGYKNEL